MKRSSSSLEWKPLKWWVISLFALGLAIWVSSMPALASPADQATLKMDDDFVISKSQTGQDAFAIGGDVTLFNCTAKLWNL